MSRTFVIPEPEVAESPPFDLLRTPVIGRFLRWRHSRTALQIPFLLIGVLMILHGLLGPSLAPKNLATVLTWLHFRGVLALVILAAGNFFCLACPFMLVRNAARKLFRPRWNWPRMLRNKWLSAGLFVLVLFLYELYDLWASPWGTAWLIIAYFAGVLIVDGLFKHAAFCKFVCPLGQFNFAASTISPLEVAVRDQEVCTGCQTKDCIRGQRQPGSDFVILQRGCELALFQPLKVGNMDCTFCLDCVHACPHDNVGILSRMPATELMVDSMRSGIGFFSRRTDIAALMLVFTFGALLNAFGMVSPVYVVEQWLARLLHVTHEAPVLATIFAFFLLVEPIVLLGGAAWITPKAESHFQRADSDNGAVQLRPGSPWFRDVARPLRLSLSEWALHHRSRDPERGGECGVVAWASTLAVGRSPDSLRAAGSTGIPDTWDFSAHCW